MVITINLTIFNIIHWVAGSIVSSTKGPMVQVLFWWIENKTVDCWFGLRALKTLYFCFCKEFSKKLWKKKILRTSDAWSMRQSSQQPSVLYWRLLHFKTLSAPRQFQLQETCSPISNRDFQLRRFEPWNTFNPEGKKTLSALRNFQPRETFRKN